MATVLGYGEGMNIDEVWLRIFCAAIGSPNINRGQACEIADCGVEDYLERFDDEFVPVEDVSVS